MILELFHLFTHLLPNHCHFHSIFFELSLVEFVLFDGDVFVLLCECDMVEQQLLSLITVRLHLLDQLQFRFYILFHLETGVLINSKAL